MNEKRNNREREWERYKKREKEMKVKRSKKFYLLVSPKGYHRCFFSVVMNETKILGYSH